MKRTLYLAAGLSFMLFSCENASSRIENGSSNEAEAVSSSVVEAQGSPTFQFNEEFHDFGDIDEGNMVEHIFKFTNTGDAPLIISNAQGSCGCTVPQWPRNPIAPGEEEEIKVSFNSAGRAGKQDKRVTLSANTVPNTYVLNITSNVIPKSKPEAE
jgi:hypothetical protein